MGMPVSELLSRTDSHELTEWMAYEQIDPFGEWRADWRAAMLASVMANIWRGKNTKATTPDDFMPEFGPRKEQTWQDMRNMADVIFGRRK
jgi:hypothetical protein